MRNAIAYSVLLHAAVLAVGYFGLPYIQSNALLTDNPILVEIVNVADLTNAPPPAAKPDKKPKPKAKKEEPPKKPPPPPKASPPPPPPEPEEVVALPPEPKPEVKPKPEPKLIPKPKPEVKTPAPVRKLAKIKPRRKPKPPDAFASVLKTVEKLKDRPKPKDKKEKPKKEKEKIKSFEDQMAQALASQTVTHNPLRPMAISEIDLVRQQIRECWSLPAGAREAENLSIEIKMAMNPDGSVRQARILDQSRLQSDPFFRAAAESALRAVLNPRCNPLKLPPEKYQQWQNMILVFDPRQMF
ncbi:MAG: cell envelope integrity protein TolA [Rhodospirillales bacterium]|nr:cell envelope integrity protein TolA [Rhodospirillales bacterium]